VKFTCVARPEGVRRRGAPQQSCHYTTSSLLRRHQSFVFKCEFGEWRVDVIELEAFAKLYRQPLSFFLP
jgi:hypothetical protein